MRISESELLDAVPRLRRFARSLSRTPAEADDLLDECLEKGLAKQHAWRGEDPTGWLMKVMAGLHRGRNRRETTARIEADGASDPVAQHRLAGAIDRLSPDNRAVLMLVVVEGYSYADAAAALGVPVATVMSRLSRSRAALAESLRSDNVIAFARRR